MTHIKSDTKSRAWPHVSASSQQPHLPFHGSSFGLWFGKCLLQLAGFRIVGDLPRIKKLVAIMGPHTSNWDPVLGMLVKLATGVRFSFMIKDSVMLPVLSSLIRRVGGIAINRNAAGGVINQMVRKFKEAESLVLVITPEGTRSGKKKLKTGFYRIARGASIPILLVCVDYRKKLVTLGSVLDSDMDYDELLLKLDEYYGKVRGKNGYWMDRNPDDFSPGKRKK